VRLEADASYRAITALVTTVQRSSVAAARCVAAAMRGPRRQADHEGPAATHESKLSRIGDRVVTSSTDGYAMQSPPMRSRRRTRKLHSRGLAQLPPTLRGVRVRGTKPREVVAFQG